MYIVIVYFRRYNSLDITNVNDSIEIVNDRALPGDRVVVVFRAFGVGNDLLLVVDTK